MSNASRGVNVEAVLTETQGIDYTTANQFSWLIPGTQSHHLLLTTHDDKETVLVKRSTTKAKR